MLSEPQLKFILDEMGPEHIMYSLDYPYKQPKNGKTFLTENSALTDEQRELFAHGNAEKLLKL
ncbi:amidohydrolase family protein [Pediococcus damnosus]|nr:amidohydrolase family protein [Pediococcus damnosus]